tara:strand:+ start:8292 stop:9767 length:1476 start_codon:yes stop_codon:yes gene_type:complete
MRTRPVVTRADATVATILAAAASGSVEFVLNHHHLDCAVHATRNGAGLLQTAAGPGASAELVRALLARYGRGLARAKPVRLGAPAGTALQREHMDVLAPLASLPVLVVAAGYGRLDVVRCLVEEFELDPAQPAVSGLTPMLAAMQRKHYAVVEYLQPRLDPSAEEWIASCMPTSSPIAMAAWLRDPQLIGMVGGTAAEWSGYYVINDGSLGTGIQAPECASPLVIALYRGNAVHATDASICDAVSAILRRGADATAPGRYARRLPHAHLSTPLQCAIDFKLPGCVRALLLARADPEAFTGGAVDSDCVPLLRAVKTGVVETVQLLLLASAGSWGAGSLRWRAFRTASLHADAEMRTFVHAVLRIPPGEQLLQWCDPDPAMFHLALRAERRPLRVLLAMPAQRAYTAAFLRRWFVWSPTTHALFPAVDRERVRVAVTAYSRVRSRAEPSSAAALVWRQLPAELMVHILTFTERTTTHQSCTISPLSTALRIL